MSYMNAIFCLVFSWLFFQHRQLNILTQRLSEREEQLSKMNHTFVKTIDGFSGALDLLGRNIDNMQTVAKENFGQITLLKNDYNDMQKRIEAFQTSDKNDMDLK